MNVNEIKEALSKATPGPWVRDDENGLIWDREAKTIIVYGMAVEDEDIELIANAPEWLASLVSQVEEMQKALDRIHTDTTDAWASGFALRTLQSLKGAQHE